MSKKEGYAIMLNEVINMKNNNSLVALAYIRENDNPFVVFCNYIIYCLSITPQNALRHDELMKKIESEFGLKMPHHMIKVCIRILLKENKVTLLLHGAGYCLKDASFDIDAFEQKRAALKKKEEELINGLVAYVKSLNGNWSYDEAREHLTYFLVTRENAYNLFANGTIEAIVPNKYIPPEWYVGKYITHLLEANGTPTDYLLDIVNGLMVYIGVYQTQDYLQEKNQKFRGTDFFIDTKLLLRVMGYSWQLEVDAATEFLNLIRSEYGGNICVFEHTIGEIESALANAADSLKRGEQIFDYELRAYAMLKKCDAFDFICIAKKYEIQLMKNYIIKYSPLLNGII